MGSGDGGLGIGIGPNPQSPIPNPQSPKYNDINHNFPSSKKLNSNLKLQEQVQEEKDSIISDLDEDDEPYLNTDKLNLNILNIYLLHKKAIFWGLGIGDWGLGIGDWGLGPIPIPNPQSPNTKPQ